jgi:excisionase family DNA binding protein
MHKVRTGPVVSTVANLGKVGWRISEWARSVGVCRATVYNLLDAGEIESVKVGSARVIRTAPADYLARLAGETR